MSLFRTPTPADRDRIADDYRERLSLVLCDGWDRYRYTWSAGEVIVVRALVSGDEDDVHNACVRLAPALWGLDGAEADRTAGYMRTRAFLQGISEG